MFYKIEPAWILLLEHITVFYRLMLDNTHVKC